MTEERLAQSLYLNAVPAYAGAALERLYQNVFSVLPGGAASQDLHTYVELSNGEPRTVLLFRHSGSSVRVVNEGLRLDSAGLERFASRVFSAFPMVVQVQFNAVRADAGGCALPFLQAACSEDFVVPLPASAAEYFSGLGRATRKNIKRYRNRLARDFPAMRQDFFEGAQVQRHHLEAILALNRARMAARGKMSGFTGDTLVQLLGLVRRYGFISVMTLDGKVVAGEICTRVGDSYFDHVGAHDPAFDDYALGILSCYQTICECIRREGRAFHFLWGRYPYKYSLGGVHHELRRITLYRSRAGLLMNGHAVLQLALGNQVRRIRAAAGQNSTVPGVRRARGLLLRLRERPAAAQEPAVHGILAADHNSEQSR